MVMMVYVYGYVYGDGVSGDVGEDSVSGGSW